MAAYRAMAAPRPEHDASRPLARWDLAGLAAGAAVALASLAATALARGAWSASELLAAHRDAPALLFTDAAPLALLLGGLAVRRRLALDRERAAAAAAREAARRADAERMARELTDASRELAGRVSSILAACARTSQTVGSTADTVQRLTGTAMQSALEAETVIGIAARSERASQSAGALADSTGAELLGLSSDVKAMAEQIQDLHTNVRHLLDVATTMAWLAQRSHGLAATAVRAALTGDVESFHSVAGDMRTHADDALWAAKQAETLIAEVADAMAQALALAEAGTQRAATGAEVVQRTGARIRSLGQALRESAAASSRVAEVAQAQGAAFDEVLAAMNDIWKATESNVAATEAVAEAARGLDEIAASLAGAVGRAVVPTPAPIPIAVQRPPAGDPPADDPLALEAPGDDEPTIEEPLRPPAAAGMLAGR